MIGNIDKKNYKYIVLAVVVIIAIIVIVVVLTSNKNEQSSTVSDSNQSSSITTTSRPTTTRSTTPRSTTPRPTTTSRLNNTVSPTTTSRLITSAAPTNILLVEELCTSSNPDTFDSCPLTNNDLIDHEYLCSSREFNDINIPWFKCLKNAYYKFNVDSSVTGNWSIKIQPQDVSGIIDETGVTTPLRHPQSMKTIRRNDIDTNNQYYFTHSSAVDKYIKQVLSNIIVTDNTTINVLENNGFKGTIELYFKDRTGNSEDLLFATRTVN